MRVEFLGSGGYHPAAGRHTACVLLPGLGLMLDAGTGAFRVHEHAGELPADRLDVLLTHAHVDHIVGLTYLLGLERAGRPVETVVHASPATLGAVRDHLLAKPLFPIEPVTRFEELRAVTTLRNGAVAKTFPLDHVGESLGVRVDSAGRSLAYVTDTRAIGGDVVDAIRGVDLLLHEANFDDALEELAAMTGHSTATQAAQAAVDAGVGQLVLIHANPRDSEAALVATAAEAQRLRPDARFATDGSVIDL